MKHPYVIMQHRIDVVKKVPGWAAAYLNVGDEVIRVNKDSVAWKAGHLRLGESYTKFKGYTTPQFG